jgi:hypothetical protein
MFPSYLVICPNGFLDATEEERFQAELQATEFGNSAR